MEKRICQDCSTKLLGRFPIVFYFKLFRNLADAVLKIQTHLHGAPLPSDPPVLRSMKAFYSHQSFPSAYEPAPPPSQPAKQRSALFLVPCAVVYTQPRLAVGPLPSLGNGHVFLRTFSFKISLCQSKNRLYKKTFR